MSFKWKYGRDTFFSWLSWSFQPLCTAQIAKNYEKFTAQRGSSGCNSMRTHSYVSTINFYLLKYFLFYIQPQSLFLKTKPNLIHHLLREYRNLFYFIIRKRISFRPVQLTLPGSIQALHFPSTIFKKRLSPHLGQWCQHTTTSIRTNQEVINWVLLYLNVRTDLRK